ncbi:hypothetical protein F5144DRAFT_565711 [Chaetomium tenue]|uniref:Uncharacterized protein n=1 Tax=Chaetomium tenue TaxID=1854479 RepID=A0ACB7PC28_9PEZI|nr:hypothetical protein F5144DRAFT_565711 [Chaetomium globosum]
MPQQHYRWRDADEYVITPPPVNCPPFSYGHNSNFNNSYTHSGDDSEEGFEDEDTDIFSMDDIPQAQSHELRRLLLDRSEAAEKDPPNKWSTTQLHLYGVSFKKSSPKSDLKAALTIAVLAGKCEELTPAVAAVRDRLRTEYDAACERLGDKMFAEIEGGHGEEANADPPRFVAKHFLDAHGRPDKEKTKIPLSFKSYNNKIELDRVVASVPGLAILKTWSTVLVGWASTMEQGIEAEFSRLETFFSRKFDIHSAQANVDLQLFLRKYLALNLDGSIITTDARPSDPVVLADFRLQKQNLAQEIIAKAPGLHMKRHHETAVIGWNEDKVDAEIASMEETARQEKEQEEAEERARLEKKEAEKKARWERRCKGYYELLAKQQGSPRPIDLQHLPGSYRLRWHGEEGPKGEDYNDPYSDDEVMRIDISHPKSPHGVKASFLLGQFEGVMLLGMSKSAVGRLRDAQPKNEDEDDLDDEGGLPRPPILAGFSDEKFFFPEDSSKGTKRTLGGISDPYGVQAARAKRQRVDAPNQPEESLHPNRVYFQFACSEVEGYPLVDTRNEHVGHLDFDPTGLAAKGVFYLPQLLGPPAQHIEIFKVAEQPGPRKSPRPWYEYDGRTWGRWW